MIACARIAVPGAKIRLSAGRTRLSDETQALCFYAGANSIFYGDKLLTASNPEAGKDRELLKNLASKPSNRIRPSKPRKPIRLAPPAPAARRRVVVRRQPHSCRSKERRNPSVRVDAAAF